MRRQHVDAQTAALGDIDGELVLVVEHARQQRRHIFARIVAFEPSGLIGNGGVGGGVGLVEGIGGKALHLAENRRSGGFVHTAAHTALHHDIAVVVGESADKDLALALHDVMLLFAHGAAHDVRSAEAVAGKLAEDLHDLLLIDDATVGHLEDALQARMLVANVLGMMAAVDIGGNAVHRTRTIERENGDQILDTIGAQLRQHILHAAALKLEHALGQAARDHGEHRRIVVAHILRLIGRMGTPDELFGVVDHGEVAQTEEIHFQQSQLLERGHGELGHDVVVVFGERHIVRDRTVGDDHACRVHGGVARHALDLPGNVNDLLGSRVGVIALLQLGIGVHRLVKRDIDLKGHHLGDLVHLVIGNAEDAPHIADRAARRHGAEGDDLRHAVVAVFFDHIADDLSPAALAEVDIKIGHADALGIQKALKQQVVFDRVDRRDADAVGAQRAGAGASAGSDGDAVALGVLHKVVDDQIVIDKAHLGNGADLILQAVGQRLVGVLSVVAVHALIAAAAKIIEMVFAVRHIKARQLALAERKGDLTAVGDLLCVLDRFGISAEQRAHFVLGFQIKLIRLKLHFILVADGAARLDAEQNAVGAAVLFFDIVAVVGRRHADAGFRGDPRQAGQNALFLLDAVILQLDKEVLTPKEITVIHRLFQRAVIVVLQQPLRYLTGKAGGQANQSLVILLKQSVVDARLVVKALGEAERHQLDQILVAGVVFAEEDHVVIVLIGAFFEPRLRRDIDLAADNGMDALLLTGAVKVDHAVHDAVVGDGKRRKPLPLGGRGYLADTAGAVQQTVFGMDM